MGQNNMHSGQTSTFFRGCWAASPSRYVIKVPSLPVQCKFFLPNRDPGTINFGNYTPFAMNPTSAGAPNTTVTGTDPQLWNT
jgi:hypothetical protein